MPTAAEFCNRHVTIARAFETLPEVAARMRREHVGSVVVVDEVDRRLFPIGILTDRDIVVGVLARADGQLGKIRVGDVMSTEPVTAREREETSELVKRMQSAGVRRIPIVNDAGSLTGIVAFDDLLENLADQVSALVQLLSRERAVEEHARPLAAAKETAPKPTTRRPAIGSKPRGRAQPPAKARSRRTGRVAAGSRGRSTAR